MLGLSRLSVRRTPTPGASSPRQISPRTLSKVTFHHVRCRVLASGCLASGRSCVSARSRWLQMAEATPLATETDTSACGMGTAGTGEVERPSTGPRAWSWCGWHVKSVSNSPLGQGGRPQLVQVSAQPAPVRTRWGWRARPRLERLPVDGSEGRPLPS